MNRKNSKERFFLFSSALFLTPDNSNLFSISGEGSSYREYTECLSFSPYPYYTTLCCVGWKARDLPSVRRKFAFHVYSVVVDDGRWSVDHFRRSVKKNILFLIITSL